MPDSDNSFDMELRVDGEAIFRAAGSIRPPIFPINPEGVIDKSGFNGGESPYTGTGSISVTQTLETNTSKQVTMKTTYTMSELRGLIFEVEVTPIGFDANNAQLWLGTGDDWVGNSDGPTKTIGTIEIDEGGYESDFEATSTGNAVTVTSLGDCMQVRFVAFAPPGSVALQADCCKFKNIIDLPPDTPFPDPIEGDGSYGLYFPLGNIAADTSAIAKGAYSTPVAAPKCECDAFANGMDGTHAVGTWACSRTELTSQGVQNVCHLGHPSATGTPGATRTTCPDGHSACVVPAEDFPVSEPVHPRCGCSSYMPAGGLDAEPGAYRLCRKEREDGVGALPLACGLCVCAH